MASRVKADWIGRNDMMNQLALIAPNAEAAIAGMQMKVARDLAEKIKRRAPVGKAVNRRRGRKPGTYRDSIEAARLADRPAKLYPGSGKIGTTTDKNATGIYGEWIWHFLEFGTAGGRTPRMPHIFPTYREEKKNMKRRMARAMRAAIKKAMANQHLNPDQEAA